MLENNQSQPFKARALSAFASAQLQQDHAELLVKYAQLQRECQQLKTTKKDNQWNYN